LSLECSRSIRVQLASCGRIVLCDRVVLQSRGGNCVIDFQTMDRNGKVVGTAA
jgi:hypothetical protein